MKKLILIAFITLTAVACKKETSLQGYIVESQNKENHITFDVPVSVLQLKMDAATDADKKAYESLKKINIAGVPSKNLDDASFEAEKLKLQTILKNSSYKELMKFKQEGMNATIYYTGKTDAIDEIIAFGYGKKAGVGIARILGKNMNPGNIMQMIRNAKFNIDNLDMNQFKSLFNQQNISEEAVK